MYLYAYAYAYVHERTCTPNRLALNICISTCTNK